MENQLYSFAEVLVGYNDKPCMHYIMQFMPLYLTCNTFYNKYLNEKLQVFDCDICYFRDIICKVCLSTNIKTCDVCTCSACGLSGNLTGCLPNDNGICDRCPSPFPKIKLDYDYVPIFNTFWGIDVWNHIHIELAKCRAIRVNTAQNQEPEKETIDKNVKMLNFKSTKYFEYKKIKKTNAIKNNYKHNGQQFRKQNQLKQPLQGYGNNAPRSR